MRRRVFAGGCLLVALAQAGEWRNVSRLPQLYTIDYSPQNHLASPGRLARLRKGPPDVFHAGKDGPFVHNWGPIAGWGGENVYGGGKDRVDYHRRLTPAELDARFAACRRYVRSMHEAGVKKLYHYVGAFTIGGNPAPDVRYGFWEFYDHWDEYTRFGVGPKPPDDPMQWLMCLPNGEPCFIYNRNYESYEPGTRWAVCLNNPYWRQWMKAVFRASAEVGFDGIFVDNSFQRCYCGTCRAEFAAFVKREKRPTTELATYEDGGRAWFDTQEFWMDSIARWLADMRAEARKVNPAFGVFPNNGTHPGYVRFSSAADYVMGEGDFWGFGPKGFGVIRFHKDPGMIRRPLVGGLAYRQYQDMIVSYKYTAAEGGTPRPVWLTHGHQGRSDVAKELRLSEAMAFGAGACTYARASLPPEIYARLRRFLSQQPQLYDGLVPYCRVGLAYFPRQAYHKGMRHVDAVWELAAALGREHIPYRVVTEGDCRDGDLSDLHTIFVPFVNHVARDVIGGLAEFANASGHSLVFCGAVPELDEAYHPVDHETVFGQAIAAKRMRVLEGVPPRDSLEVLCLGGGPAGPSIVASVDAGGDALRVEMRASRDGRRVVVHLLNYGIPLESHSERPEELRGVHLRIPIGREPNPGARLYTSREETPTSLYGEPGLSGELEITVPSVRIYSIVEVSR
ncbi:MAG: hypothetical protein HN742_22340 [Lentisphaerae bacterium]|jgi:hypothetical protein|nr:hypothetical protein [Lentisphaerota bacterium]MBT4814831.1 hypothetical protein [Lentisphaerota bacterium]MBT5604962.1 hypothetical protein [Lentisphaerota bacterium]MBT7055970.1 hypothetical protein [Lentisphaerota bacterium]MBT7844633.1 hypothetical protein [Lentisphaerota bacterium]